MKAEELWDAVGDINDEYVKGARQTMTGNKKIRWKIMGVAACFCLLLAGGVLYFHSNGGDAVPQPQEVQVANPIMELESAEKMGEYLDFDVPELKKDVDSYLVFVEDQHAAMGQINYTDGSSYRVRYGSGDISGVYGGSLIETNKIEDVDVELYEYESTRYAIWEDQGFTFSYTFGDDGVDTVTELIDLFRQAR